MDKLVKWKSRALAMAFALLVPCLSVFLLPHILAKPPLLEEVSFGKIVLDRSGGILRMGLSSDDKYRLRVHLGDIAPEAVSSLLHYEDKYFYRHPGINIFSLVRSLGGMITGGRKMGASTITMQTARLRYKLRTSSLRGKLEQIWMALLLEAHYSKEEILEAYFNLAPYGGNIEGIEAASRIYFNKPAIHLTDSECHSLIVVPQNPVARNPVDGKDFPASRKRLEMAMAKNSNKGIMLNAPLKPRSLGEISYPAAHLSLELLRKMDKGKNIARSTIDPGLQRLLEKAITGYARRNKRYGINNCAAILVNTESMDVEALSGSADFTNTEISGQIDGTRARRSPGSTLKPFIYALALEGGIIHPASMLPDSPRSFGGYDPENFDRGFRGPLAAGEALRASRNLPAIYLAEKLRYPGLYGFLREAGVSFTHDADHYGLALALGGAEITMRELAVLYAMLANQGLWQNLRLERDEEWKTPARLLSPEAAFIALNMLESPDATIRSRKTQIPVRYKTGTSNGMRDAWTAGIVGQYVLIVWIGNFNNEANPYFVGARAALPLFWEIANILGADRPLRDTQQGLEESLNVAKAPVCAATGDFEISHCRETLETWYIPGISPVRDTGILRPVLIDRETGLRACRPEAGKTEEVWWEFWPSDMREIFIHAGINKPLPPEWLPECENLEKSMPVVAGPRILLPKKNVAYQRRINGPPLRVPLRAAADSDAGRIHWFAGRNYLGSSKAGDTLFWEPDVSGNVEIMAVDDLGRSSKRKCGIMALP